MLLSLQNPSGAVDLKDISDLICTHIDANRWRNVLLIPPDITRSHSGAGLLTSLYYKELTKGGCRVKVLPALGTHCRMTEAELRRMFGDIPMEAYLVHDFRRSITEIGTVPGSYLAEISEGLFTEKVSVAINRELLNREYDAILSIGQVIPHEIAGMANYTKNIVVGCGGGEMINVSHFLGVFYGLERLLGVDQNPVRLLFDYVQENLLKEIPFLFVQTVMAQIDGRDVYKGVFIGEGREPYNRAVELSQRVNFNHVERPIRKCVVWMDPDSYHSTWVTNKAIYRTELAVQQDGEIIIIAPGVCMFGENDLADGAIRKYGYLSREKVLELRRTDRFLQENLSLAGHLIHGVPGRGIRVTYCTNKLTREEIEHAGFRYMTVDEALAAYPCRQWENGWHTLPSGEEVYFVANAALGMWRCEEQPRQSSERDCSK
ncbi:lactate racemase domain-containing protein [Yanshouia hominis]|uniref:DUF2088 domain-containing protein n=1 Tax=Yanshouia hominis TaxID=2763673 RepID=A0ABR7NEV1_9FIRM|nr:lactate racemase domain-containing protein [Yanshouia hominis]MBC8574942.1 DUF2088 domain-containing protein [Yanshouia hominis]